MTETLSSTYTLYTSSSCARCPLARKSMEKAGVKWREVALDEPGNELLLEDIKENVSASVPVVLTPKGDYLTNLATISQHFQGVQNG